MTPQQTLASIFGHLGGQLVRGLAQSRSRRRDLEALADVSAADGDGVSSGFADVSDAPCDCKERAAQLRRQAAARFGRRG